ncbi:MAG: adenylate/guanylate cyclase domain-containing protein [Woeseiaceae bacterium]|nr:adenylate/guanylate cyclase domain-containing protein [Woeseiaceae bacterium]|tara:strand:+ start:562 stop:2754 length:2193 start_codon:yes stop_codon:yes gene_type:complete
MKINWTTVGKRTLLPFAILLAFLPLLDPMNIFSDLRLRSFDTFQQMYPREKMQDDPVVLVDIDDESLSRYGQWPWPRNLVSELVNQTYYSLATGFDIVFAEPDRTGSSQLKRTYQSNPSMINALESVPDHDEIFSDAIENHGTVVLGLAPNNNGVSEFNQLKSGLVVQGDDPKQFLNRYIGVESNIEILENVSSGLGSMSIGNNDSIVRTIPTFELIGDQLLPSFPLEVLRVAVGANTYQIKSSNASSEQAFGEATGINHVKLGNLVMPTNPDGSLWIYSTKTENMNIIPAWQILDGTVDPEYFDGKITVVGTSASGLFDLRSSALEKNIPGVTIVAQFIQQIVSGTFLQRPDWLGGLELISGLLLSIIITLAIQRFGPIGGLVIFLTGVGSIFVGSYYLFMDQRFLVDPISPTVICLISYLVITFFNFLFTELERSKVRTAFSQYLAPAMVDRLAESSESLVLGGETKEMTMLFSDIRGFTGISEQYKDDPEGLTQLINKLLSVLSDEILLTEGTIDKYMGDCIMAFWNAPTDQPQHASLAVKAAMEMGRAMQKLNEELAAEGKKTMAVGIGINTGDCVVGNMGSTQRFDYTVLGDTVNLASRLEGQSGEYGFQIIAGADTVKSLSGYEVFELDLLAVKGKTEPVTIYTVFEGDESDIEDAESFRAAHQEFLQAYRGQDWDTAMRHIEKYQKEVPSFNYYYELFSARIKSLQKNPPGPEWTGVFVALSK